MYIFYILSMVCTVILVCAVPIRLTYYLVMLPECLYVSECARAHRYYLLLQLAMRDAKTSGNFDDPEGGTDALLQAVVCTNVRIYSVRL